MSTRIKTDTRGASLQKLDKSRSTLVELRNVAIGACCSATCTRPSVSPEAAPPDRAVGARTRQPENSKRAHLSAPALQKHHQNSTRRLLRERRKNEISGGREKKKREIPPTLRAPTFSGFGPLRAPTPSGPHPFGPPPLRAPLQKQKIGQMRSTKNWPNSAK